MAGSVVKQRDPLSTYVCIYIYGKIDSWTAVPVLCEYDDYRRVERTLPVRSFDKFKAEFGGKQWRRINSLSSGHCRYDYSMLMLLLSYIIIIHHYYYRCDKSCWSSGIRLKFAGFHNYNSSETFTTNGWIYQVGAEGWWKPYILHLHSAVVY